MNIDEIEISGNPSVNSLARQQEKCLEDLISHIEKPFKDRWEYSEWHRQAIRLELSQTEENEFLDDRAFWELILKDFKDVNGEITTKEIREEIIYIIHNILEIQFSKARMAFNPIKVLF